MEIKKQKHLLLSLVIILAILNLGTIGYLLYQKGSSTHAENLEAPPPQSTRGMPRGEGPNMADSLKNRFDFDEEQMQQMKVLWEEHRGTMRTLTDSIRQLRTKQVELIASYEENQKQIYDYAHEIGSLYSQIHIHTIKHFQGIKDLAKTPQQVKAVNEFFSDASMHKRRGKRRYR